MPANREGMHNGLIDEPDDDYKSPEVRYSVFENRGKSGQRFCQEPFKVATACLSAFCLILLMILVITSVHNGKSRSSDQDSLPSAAETQMQTGCANVTALTEELQTVKKEKSELEKERSQLKDKIAKLEATPAPQTSLAPMKSSCSEDWKHFNGSCYYISSFGRTWSDSQRYCKRNGGNLAIILTAEEQTFIWDLLPRGYWNAFWFGISDEKVEDDWHWVDGTKLVGGLFGQDGLCASCEKRIRAFEMTMRVRDKVYHLECFKCAACQKHFCVGDRYLLINSDIVCEQDIFEWTKLNGSIV